MSSKLDGELNVATTIHYRNLLRRVCQYDFPIESRHCIESIDVSHIQVSRIGTAHISQFELDTHAKQDAIACFKELHDIHKNVCIENLTLEFTFEAPNPYGMRSFSLKLVLPESIWFQPEVDGELQALGYYYLQNWQII